MAIKLMHNNCSVWDDKDYSLNSNLTWKKGSISWESGSGFTHDGTQNLFYNKLFLFLTISLQYEKNVSDWTTVGHLPIAPSAGTVYIGNANDSNRVNIQILNNGNIQARNKLTANNENSSVCGSIMIPLI